MDGCIFDFNGTLLFDTPYHLEAWNRMSEELTGRSLDHETLIRDFAGVPNIVCLQNMRPGGTKEWYEQQSEHKEELYREIIANLPEKAQLVTGAEELFDLLKANRIPFTIASASIKANIDFFVETFGLDRWMDPEKIIYDNNTYENKTAMFRNACHVLGVSEEVLVFEDSPSGIRSAEALDGSRIIAIDSGWVRERRKEDPRIILAVKNLRESVDTVRNLFQI
ncbi:MAG: HAD family phosphatase [Solobacterium sp.]|nr:HAD family phosphatase [Solobacterium sp.]